MSRLSTAENWPVTPIAARTASGSRARSWPATRTSPPSARISVDRICTVVVLPAPLGPSSAKTVPSATSRSMPSSTTLSPNDLRSPVAAIALVMLLPFAITAAWTATITSRVHAAGFIAVSRRFRFAGSGARRSVPPENWNHAKCPTRCASYLQSYSSPIRSPAWSLIGVVTPTRFGARTRNRASPEYERAELVHLCTVIIRIGRPVTSTESAGRSWCSILQRYQVTSRAERANFEYVR